MVRADLELTYTKWIAPGFPNMVGVVGGDIVGKFGGAILERTVNGSLDPPRCHLHRDRPRPGQVVHGARRGN